MYADYVLALYDALTIWAASGDSAAVGKCPLKLLFRNCADPRFFVLNLFLVAGAGVAGLVSIVVSFLVSATTQNVETMAVYFNRGLSQRLFPIMCNFGQHSFNHTKWEKRYRN